MSLCSFNFTGPLASLIPGLRIISVLCFIVTHGKIRLKRMDDELCQLQSSSEGGIIKSMVIIGEKKV